MSKSDFSAEINAKIYQTLNSNLTIRKTVKFLPTFTASMKMVKNNRDTDFIVSMLKSHVSVTVNLNTIGYIHLEAKTYVESIH